MTADAQVRPARIQPSLVAGLLVVAAYMLVVNGLQFMTGISYDEWFTTPENAIRTAVVPLGVGAVLLLGFVRWARWDGVFRDPAQLPMPRWMWILPVVVLVLIGSRLLGVDWSGVSPALALALVGSCVLVGWCEEVLFRGILLRSARTNRRPEGFVVLIVSIGFGLFHAGNLLLGVAPGQSLIQIVFATLTGVSLLLFRRGTTLLLTPMVVHGAWDFSTFVSAASPSAGPITSATGLLVVPMYALAVATLISVAWHDRRVTVTSRGPEDLTD